MKAFPVTKFNSHRVGHDGMDLRDYFAAKAMQALIQKDSATFLKGKAYDIDSRAVADGAYGYADAMLEQRQR